MLTGSELFFTPHPHRTIREHDLCILQPVPPSQRIRCSLQAKFKLIGLPPLAGTKYSYTPQSLLVQSACEQPYRYRHIMKLNLKGWHKISLAFENFTCGLFFFLILNSYNPWIPFKIWACFGLLCHYLCRKSSRETKFKLDSHGHLSIRFPLQCILTIRHAEWYIGNIKLLLHCVDILFHKPRFFEHSWVSWWESVWKAYFYFLEVLVFATINILACYPNSMLVVEVVISQNVFLL